MFALRILLAISYFFLMITAAATGLSLVIQNYGLVAFGLVVGGLHAYNLTGLHKTIEQQKEKKNETFKGM